jgi:hypothetical protein
VIDGTGEQTVTLEERRRCEARPPLDRYDPRWSGAQPVLTRKQEAACCIVRIDSEGRLPIGFCSPGCVRRDERDRRSRLR